MEVISLVTVHYIKGGIGHTQSEKVIRGRDRSYKVNQVSTVHEVTYSKLLFSLFRFWIQLYTVNVHIRNLHVQVDTYEEEQLTIFYADQICRNVGLSGISEFGSYLHIDSFCYTNLSTDSQVTK